jgi:hypothetical protein
MEQAAVLLIVFVSIGLFIWNVVKVFKGKDSCCSCEKSKDCSEDKVCS